MDSKVNRQYTIPMTSPYKVQKLLNILGEWDAFKSFMTLSSVLCVSYVAVNLTVISLLSTDSYLLIVIKIFGFVLTHPPVQNCKRPVLLQLQSKRLVFFRGVKGTYFTPNNFPHYVVWQQKGHRQVLLVKPPQLRYLLLSFFHLMNFLKQ